jgi:hypothetical protein
MFLNQLHFNFQVKIIISKLKKIYINTVAIHHTWFAQNDWKHVVKYVFSQ